MDEGNRDEENNNEANSGSWWGSLPSWFQTAKEKSSTALEFMKRDLSEFRQVVQTDAVAAVSSTAAILKETLTVDTAEAVADKARQSITSVIGTITDVFVPHKELEEGELMIIKDSEPVLMDWWQTQIFMIRTDPRTFCHEPEGPPEMYENWLESFDPCEYQDDMTEIIMSCSETRALYDKLVPSSVSHLEFWQRYFYRVHLLRKAEAKRAELMRKAELISIDDIDWDKEPEISRRDKRQTNDQSHSKSAEEITDSDSASTIPKTILSDTHATSGNAVTVLNIIQIENEGAKTLTNDEKPTEASKISLDSSIISVNNEATPKKTGPSTAESTDENRSSPVESLGKDSSTGDEWEKDFDLEINESDLKNLDVINQESQKEADDWEKW